MLIPTGDEEEFKQLGITSLLEGGGVEGQVHIDAAYMWFFRVGQKEIGDPAAHQDYAVRARC